MKLSTTSSGFCPSLSSTHPIENRQTSLLVQFNFLKLWPPVTQVDFSENWYVSGVSRGHAMSIFSALQLNEVKRVYDEFSQVLKPWFDSWESY